MADDCMQCARVEQLEALYATVLRDIILEYDPAFPTTPEEIMAAGGSQFHVLLEDKFQRMEAGLWCLIAQAITPGYDCNGPSQRQHGGTQWSRYNLMLSLCTLITALDPGYDCTWQGIRDQAGTFLNHRQDFNRACIIYMLFIYESWLNGTAPVTRTVGEALSAGCCVGAGVPPYWPTAFSAQAASSSPPVVSDALLFGAGDQVTLEDVAGTLDNETGGAGEVRIGDLTEATELQPVELLYAVDDPGGAPLSRRMTLQDFLDSLNNLASGATTALPQSVTPVVLDPSGVPDPRSVSLETLYAYLATVGAILPDGFHLRTHMGSNAGLGSQGSFNGPGFWNYIGTFLYLSSATAALDMQRVRQNNSWAYSGTTSRLGQYPKANWVGRTWNNDNALNNRYWIGWTATVNPNIDAPTFACAAFKNTVGEYFYRCVVHDGTSLTHNFLTTVPISNYATGPYELKIIVTNTPSIQFWAAGVMVYEALAGGGALPNFNTLGLYWLVAVGNSEANSWIETFQTNVIIPNF